MEATLFFDRYLKGIRNGWEVDARVRVDVMDAYDFDYQVQAGRERIPAGSDRVQEALCGCRQPGSLPGAGIQRIKMPLRGETRQGHVRCHF